MQNILDQWRLSYFEMVQPGSQEKRRKQLGKSDGRYFAAKLYIRNRHNSQAVQWKFESFVHKQSADSETGSYFIDEVET